MVCSDMPRLKARRLGWGRASVYLIDPKNFIHCLFGFFGEPFFNTFVKPRDEDPTFFSTDPDGKKMRIRIRP